MAIPPAFQTSGIASGIDTTTLIDNLVKIQGATVTTAKSRQAAFTSQISAVADITAKLKAFQTAAKSLKDSGALAFTQVGTTSGFTATATPNATAGRYSVSVTELAQAARGRSTGFASGAAEVTEGSLTLGVGGTNYNVAINAGDSLQTVAASINSSGAPVSAAVLTADGQTYLSITTRNTGYTPGGDPTSALAITENSTGSSGQALGATIVQQAKNAVVEVDGLSFERSSNTITDAIPGLTLNLSKKGGAAEDLVLQTSTDKTKENLQAFVDAYNAVMKAARGNLNIAASTDRDRTLGGDNAVRNFQSALLDLASAEANPGSSVRTLADIGIKTQSDGSLKIDSSRLESAIGNDPAAVNNLFQKATSGIGASVEAMANAYTSSVDGVFTNRSKGLNNSVKRADKEIELLQKRLDQYRARLVKQFTAMEQIVGNFKGIGSFLTSREKQSNN